MTFSEYISNIAVKDYVEYCKKNNITPQRELQVETPKLCALVLPKTKTETKDKNDA